MIQSTFEQVSEIESIGHGSAPITAAHMVFSGRRQATRSELLLSTIIEILSSGPCTSDDVLSSVSHSWPHSGVTNQDVRAALEMGALPPQALFLRTEDFDGVELWRLDQDGEAEAALASQWTLDVRRRIKAELVDRARSDFRECSDVEAEFWVARLTKALTAAIAAGQEAFGGGVEPVPNGIRPRAMDRALLVGTLTEGCDASVAEFLVAAALAAVDPSDPFGNELVSSIATACILHAYLARVDVAAEQAALGTLEGQKALLDTPILVGLVAGRAVREPLERMLAAARESGVKVVAVQHYLDELNDLVESRDSLAQREAELMEDPEGRAAYVALVNADDVLAAYAECLNEGLVSSWQGFKAYVRQLPRRLESSGVEVRPHGNADHEQVAKCRTALVETLDEKNRGRASLAVDRDAESLSMALRHRRRHRRDHPKSQWPGLFVITYDKALTPAYQLISMSTDPMPLALTPSSFILMLARVRPVPEVPKLAEAASQLLTREVAERVAVRYAPEVAAELAYQLSGSAGSTDVRVAQFASIVDVIESAAADEIAGEVLRRRIQRQQAAANHAAEVEVSGRKRVDEQLRRMERAQAELSGRNIELSSKLSAEEARTGELQKKLDSHLTPEQVLTLRRRSNLRTAAAVLNLSLIMWQAPQGNLAWVGILVLCGFLFWFQTSEWASDAGIRLRSAWIGMVADAIAVGSFVVSMFRGP